jgi:serine/threonine protein kinase
MALGATIPVAALIFLGLVALIVALVVIIQRKGNKTDDWEINYSELEVGEHLGSGGFGEVHRATWKGTEVAVKVMASDRITRDMEKSFKDEVLSSHSLMLTCTFLNSYGGEQVRVMTSLRHPNVVLFMAASTKAPKMCIVMEFMTLGSLYDVRSPRRVYRFSSLLILNPSRLSSPQLLHNELIPDIPMALKAKMAYQASKGMHFLHSSGTWTLAKLQEPVLPPG